MITEKIIRRIDKFETEHEISSFILIILLTIFITRTTVLIKDFNPIIRGYELHHFYYGIILLIITTILLLFGRRHYKVYLTLSAISIGLITDEFLFVLGRMNSLDEYFTTLPSVIIFALVIVIIVEIIHILYKEKGLYS